MKKTRIVSLITAAALITAPVFATEAYASVEEHGGVTVAPSYSEFNENDVNGAVMVALTENLTANVKITLDSPEESDEIYYEAVIDGSKAPGYSFELEGFDNVIAEDGTIEDGRLYTLSISVTDSVTGLTSRTYTVEDISVPDEGNGEDSWVIYGYNVTAEEKTDELDWYTEPIDLGYENIFVENLTFFLSDNYLKGDVNEDKTVDSSDASSVLAEYARTATGNPATFTSNQKLAGDVNEDTFVDSSDASKILAYYASAATGGTPTWD